MKVLVVLRLVPCVLWISWLSGLSYRLSGVRSSELGIPSPLVAEKLSICGDLGPNSLTGSIPVKRARSSAANSRPRGTHCGTSPGNADFL